jgi:uroporphyrinogen-III decarboxylase
MIKLNSTERLMRTLSGGEIDRVPLFDILHNVELLEQLAGDRINPKNAEDLLCRAASKSLDLIRHFSVPDNLEPVIFRDECGFVYKYQWWTAHLIERPEFRSSKDTENAVKKDIEIIHDCIEKGKLCRLARQHVMLFDERFETFEEVKAEFKRVTGRLDGTLMLPPEDVSAVAIATERYDETGWWYLWYDYPETAVKYLDALTDYQLAFIEAFADADVCPFTQISVMVGTGSGLLYSPEFMRNEVLPREKKKVEAWKKHGYHVLAFLDGYKWPLIDDFLDIGVEEIHPCETYCGMDVKTFREKYPEIPLGQPIDCTNLLPFGTVEDVKQAVVKAIEDAGKRKIIIGSTSEIHPQVKVENALAMYETARAYRL